jgi:hypothetical protein
VATNLCTPEFEINNSVIPLKVWQPWSNLD